ncbi:pilus assembly protein TadG-related protein [Oxalobacteraceae bacterium OTU3CAMAD1]|nr:pilus assembly protein TadG-related protein [Oxalobacteraceae bacterium OTU3CAMAD1]
MKQGVNLGMGQGRQRGAIAIVFGLMLACLIGFVGVALDLGRVYNRRADLQAVANVAALTAARQLNGTAAGINGATTQALIAMNALKYQYNQLPVAWDQRALSFSASPNGGWVDVDTARAAPDGLTYARVATGDLDASMGNIELFFMRVLSDALSSMDVAVTAVAGRSGIDVAPLAVCALSNIAAAPRANPLPTANVELVQYGFRRGVAYDLMQLNPGGTGAENFVIDPFSPPGVAGALANIAPGVVGPYVCTGQLGMPRVTGGALTVGRPFPLASLFNQFNSRFDQYTGALCTYSTAPPDTNIRQYAFGAAGSGTPWMSVAPAGQVAQSTTIDGKLWTVADPLSQPPGTTGPMYGPLWAYARAVQYSAYVAGAAEPAAGYTPFATSAWSSLYGPGAPGATGYPSGSSTPYRATSGANFQAPPLARKGAAGRRVLNVALLSCPVPAGALATATVLGIGKFLMTVPATATSVRAEFGGLVAEQSLGGAVELYP